MRKSLTQTAFCVCAAAALGPSPALAQTTSEPPFSSARASQVADSILQLMTLDEKVGQLNQLPGRGSQTGPRVPAGGEALVRAGKVGAFPGNLRRRLHSRAPARRHPGIAP